MIFEIKELDPQNIKSVAYEFILGSNLVLTHKNCHFPRNVLAVSIEHNSYLVEGWEKYWVEAKDVVTLVRGRHIIVDEV